MAENKHFLDSIGVAYLWEKINQYFSQIGHKHETSDVNGLDEYMEENSKAIKDTEMVVKQLSELPLYPTKEQVGKVYIYNKELYRAVKLNQLIINFNDIEGTGDDGAITSEDIVDYINNIGKNIILDSNEIDLDQSEMPKEMGGAILYEGLNFGPERSSSMFPDNWNPIFVKGYSVTCGSYVEDYETRVNFYADDYHENDYSWEFNTPRWQEEPDDTTKSVSFGTDGTYKYINYVDNMGLYSMDSDELVLKQLVLDLRYCANQNDYDNNIFSDFLVWQKIPEEQIVIEDTTSASTDTRKRFYRELSNNNIYVTDADYTPGESATIYVTHDLGNNVSIDSESNLTSYMDPQRVWINNITDIENIYGNTRSFINNLQQTVNITPIRLGSGDNDGGLITLLTKQEVDVYFLPWYNQRNDTGAFVNSSGATVNYEFNDGEAGGEFEISAATDLYVENCVKKLKIPKNCKASIWTSSAEGKHRCLIYKIVPIIADMDNFRWEQVAKIKDVQEMIDAIPEPVIGDVQIYDWESGKDLPIIDETQIKNMYRQDSSLYTAVYDGEGYNFDASDYSRGLRKKSGSYNNVTVYNLGDYIFTEQLDEAWHPRNGSFFSVRACDVQSQARTNGGVKLGTGSGGGEFEFNFNTGSRWYTFNGVTVDMMSFPDTEGEYTQDDTLVNIDVFDKDGVQKGHASVEFKRWAVDPEIVYEWADSEFKCSTHYDDDYSVRCYKISDYDERVDELYDRILNASQIQIDGNIFSSDRYSIGALDYNSEDDEPYYYFDISFDTEIYVSHTPLYIYRGIPSGGERHTVQREQLTIDATDCSNIVITTTELDGQNYTVAHRAVIKNIWLHTLTYSDSNMNTLDYYKRRYWKQISGGGGSIKVIDLTGEN